MPRVINPPKNGPDLLGRENMKTEMPPEVTKEAVPFHPNTSSEPAAPKLTPTAPLFEPDPEGA